MEFLLGLEVSVLRTVVTAAEVHEVEFGFTAVPDGDLDGSVSGLHSQPCAVLEAAVFWGVPQFGGDPTCAENLIVLGEPSLERVWGSSAVDARSRRSSLRQGSRCDGLRGLPLGFCGVSRRPVVVPVMADAVRG